MSDFLQYVAIRRVPLNPEDQNTLSFLIEIISIFKKMNRFSF